MTEGVAEAPVAGPPPMFEGGMSAAQYEKTAVFVRSDLEHLFDDVGVDKANFEPDVVFSDPLNRFVGIDAYLLNIQFLRVAFRPQFKLNALAQTGPWELQARWTMSLTMPSPLPSLWNPPVAFTGVSIYDINPKTGLVAKHTDFWDSLPADKQRFLSRDAVRDFVQMATNLEQTPKLESPSYELLMRTADYEVRQYADFRVAETPTNSSNLVDGEGFNTLAQYISGDAKQDMTTPVFTTADAVDTAGVAMQFVLEEGNETPRPSNDRVTTRDVSFGLVAARRFSGIAPIADVDRESGELLRALKRDGVQILMGSGSESVEAASVKEEDRVVLARYNEPSCPPWARRNEVLVPITGFKLPDKWEEPTK